MGTGTGDISSIPLSFTGLSDGAADYYVLAETGDGLAGDRQLIVLHRDGGIVVAR